MVGSKRSEIEEKSENSLETVQEGPLEATTVEQGG